MRAHRRAVAGFVSFIALAGCADREEELAPAEPDRVARAEAELAAERVWAGLWHCTLVAQADAANEGVRSHLGRWLYQTGHWGDAIGAFVELSELRPLDRLETLALADALRRESRIVAAESLFTDAIDRFGDDDTRPFYGRGETLRAAGRFEEALGDFERALALDGSSELARLAIAELRLDRGEFGAARAALGGLSSSPSDSAHFHALSGRVATQLGETGLAIEHLEAAARIDAFATSAHHLLAQTLKRAGDRDGARAAAKRHARLREEVRSHASKRAELAVTAAARALEAGDEDGAVEILTTAWHDDSDHAGVNSMLGPLLRSRGDVAGAQKSFTALRRITGGGSPGPLFLSTAHRLRNQGYLATAARLFEVASNRMPENEEPIFFRAVTLLASGDVAGARAAAAPLEAAREPREE